MRYVYLYNHVRMSEYKPYTSMHTRVCDNVYYYLCGLMSWDATTC